MLKKLCHDQVKILLERMDTHPEEFVGRNAKWEKFLPGSITYFPHFTKLEQYLIRKKYRTLLDNHCRQKAYDQILETLVFKEPEYMPTYIGTPPTGASVMSNTITLGSETLDQETIKHMKEHLKEMRRLGQI